MIQLLYLNMLAIPSPDEGSTILFEASKLIPSLSAAKDSLLMEEGGFEPRYSPNPLTLS